MTRSAAPATSTLEPPCTETSTPPAAAAARPATSAATSAARSASREPSRTRWPTAASRTASPRPCGPVPPSTPTTRSSTARSSAMTPIMPGQGGPLSVALPGAVLRGQRLLALGHRLHGVLGLLARRVRPEAVALGAAVPRLDRVVLETEEPRALLGHVGGLLDATVTGVATTFPSSQRSRW